MTPKQQKIQETVLEVIALLDTKDGKNVKKYKEIFDLMDDKAFDKWANWCNDPKDLDQLDHTVYIETMPFEEPSLKNILKGLDVLNVPAEEYTYFRDFGDEDDLPVRSKYKIPVGYVAIKRMEQLLSKKNKYSLDASQRSIKTDQVSGDSKVASIVDSEAYALISIGADDILKELYGARSGDQVARNELYKNISLNGYASLGDVTANSTPESKSTLNTLNTYMIASGIMTDLITDNLKLQYTVKKEINGK